MGLNTEKIESKSWDHRSKVRKWRKNQLNRYIRRQKVDMEDNAYKYTRKPTYGWEY